MDTSSARYSRLQHAVTTSSRRWVYLGLVAIFLLTLVGYRHHDNGPAFEIPSKPAFPPQPLHPEAIAEAPKSTVDPGDTRRLSFENVYNTNEWSSSESHSGKGSTMKYTARVRQFIDYAIHKYSLKSMVDAPSGDCNWQPHLQNFPNINYTGADIVAKIVLDNAKKYKNLKNARFMNLDLVQDELPDADFFLVRDVIQHLPLEDGVQILKNVEATSAKYLISNFHVQKGSKVAQANYNIEPGRFFGNNLMLEPYNLPEPLAYILDMDDDYFNREGDEMHIKFVAIWKLPALGRGTGKSVDVDFEVAKNIVHLHDGLQREGH